jgi:hypothetical protein
MAPDLSGVVYELQVSPRRRFVDADASFYLRAGRDHLCLRLWMREEQIRSLAIVTASNPGGKVLHSAMNWDRMMELSGIVSALHYERMQRRADAGLCVESSYHVWSTPGCGDKKQERHLAVPDVDRQWAHNMAARFGQVAFVWVERVVVAVPGRPGDAVEVCVPELVMVQE